MLKTIVAIIGIIVFISALGIMYSFQKGESKATALDKQKKIFAISQGPPFCSWKVTLSQRVISENKSEAILISTSNPTDTECESTLSLRAPGFEMAPAKDEQIVTLKPHGKGSISWIITPYKTGTFDITVSDIINTKIMGVTVTNVFGFSTTQAKLFSILGSIFGPMFTLPWWWDRWRGRKSQAQIQKNIPPSP